MEQELYSILTGVRNNFPTNQNFTDALALE
jgi:hypothetical protein